MTAPYYQRNGVTLHHGDCLDVLATLEPVHAIVTDPPYGLGFMGKTWDGGVAFDPATWRACLDALRPGGWLLAFGGSRTSHRMACAIEDAGFELRDTIMWLYGSGFPKSHDVSKAIDREAGARREVIGARVYGDGHIQRSAESIGFGGCDPEVDTRLVTAPATEAAKQWQGWGTALKPAFEPIIVARKPLDGTVAANVRKHGCGGLNIDAARVGTDEIKVNGWKCGGEQVYNGRQREGFDGGTHAGRWPANVAHDGSDEVLEAFAASGEKTTHGNAGGALRTDVGFKGGRSPLARDECRSDSGSAARFFYCGKASKADRGEGNAHPTVKPQALMRWLVRLVCPIDGVVLDLFAGSGSTAVACVAEGRESIGIEQNKAYCEIAARRLDAACDAVPLPA